MTLFMAAVLAIMMVSAAFVVDLGMQRVARSDLQAVADLVALDLARELDGRTVAQLESVLATKALQSLARNADVVGEEEVDLDYELGVMGGQGFQEVASGVPTTVRVTAQTDVLFAFAGVTGEDSGAAERAASAESSSTACFRLGTFVAAIRSGDSTVLEPLNELLGVNLDLVSYRGLANADVRLSQLTAVSTIGSPEQLLTGQVRYADLLRAMAEALSLEGGNNQVAISALNQLAGSTVAASVGMIRLGDVLHVAPTDRAALEVALSVLDIVGSARLANGQHFLSVPNIQGGVPGVGFQFTGGIYLVSAAELACGAPNTDQATADTAQLDGSVAITFTNLPSINIGGLGTLQTPKGTGTFQIDAGSGTGRLVAPPAVRCGQQTLADPSTFSVDVATQLASYSLSANVTVGGDVKTTDLLGLGLTSVITNLLGNILLLGTKLSVEVDVTMTVGTSTAAGGGTVGISIPPNDVTPVSTGSSVHLDPATVVPTVTSVKIGGKSAPLGSVTALTNLIVNELVAVGKGFFEKSLTPLIDNINQDFIGPVARMVGLRLGGADVFGVGVTCGMPRLVG